MTRHVVENTETPFFSKPFCCGLGRGILSDDNEQYVGFYHRRCLRWLTANTVSDACVVRDERLDLDFCNVHRVHACAA